MGTPHAARLSLKALLLVGKERSDLGAFDELTTDAYRSVLSYKALLLVEKYKAENASPQTIWRLVYDQS
jgi:hypothetical protein